jgi:hypothetical protein
MRLVIFYLTNKQDLTQHWFDSMPTQPVLTQYWFDCSSHISSTRPHSTLVWLYANSGLLHSTLVWLFKSRQLNLSTLNTDLALQVMQAQLILSQHWFNSSSDINHAKVVPNWTMQINLLWSHSSYAYPDSTCLVRTTSISESASQFHVSRTNELHPSSHTRARQPMRSSGSQLNGLEWPKKWPLSQQIEDCKRVHLGDIKGIHFPSDCVFFI